MGNDGKNDSLRKRFIRSVTSSSDSMHDLKRKLHQIHRDAIAHHAEESEQKKRQHDQDNPQLKQAMAKFRSWQQGRKVDNVIKSSAEKEIASGGLLTGVGKSIEESERMKKAISAWRRRSASNSPSVPGVQLPRRKPGERVSAIRFSKWNRI